MLIVLLFAFGQGAMAWDGLGTSTNPYRIQDSNDWKQLADEVLFGNSFSGKFFEMTADIDADGVSVGADGRPFSGIFDGYSHTLTYNRGYSASGRTEYVDDYCAPFRLLEGATIRHLKVEGAIFSSRHQRLCCRQDENAYYRPGSGRGLAPVDRHCGQ